jgi:hypothetical protein
LDAVYIPPTGQINAWDNPAWVKAIEAAKRKTLPYGRGTLTSIRMAFPAILSPRRGFGNSML